MRSDQRYVVREAIRREQEEYAREPEREPPRRDAREYERYEEDEQPRREVRHYERREYQQPPPQYREAAPAYYPPEPGAAYPDREAEAYYPARQERPSYSQREPQPYTRRERRPAYPVREPGQAYPPRESTVRRSLHERPQRREEWRTEESHDEETADEPVAPAWFAVTRATAFFLGCLTLLNLLAEMRLPQFSAAGWWIDLAFLPRPASRGVLGLSAALFIAFALFPRANTFVRRLGAACTLGLIGAVGCTLYRYYHHDHAGQAVQTLPIPFALHVGALLIVALAGQLTGWWERTNFFKDFLIGSVTLVTCAVVFPLAHFACIGQLDDRGAVDTAAVFAGRPDADKPADNKSPSNPFRAACQLYREGKIKKIVLVARPSELESADETSKILRRAAVAEGVAETDLLVPPAPAASGDSRVALAGVAKFFDEQKLPQVVIVARFYEVPRIKLALQRAGLDAHALPVREELRTASTRALLAREAAALWMCYVQPAAM
jgi:vancomycin permeability regulator SanA